MSLDIRTIFKWSLQKYDLKLCIVVYSSGQRQVSTYEHSNQNLGSLKCRKYLDFSTVQSSVRIVPSRQSSVMNKLQILCIISSLSMNAFMTLRELRACHHHHHHHGHHDVPEGLGVFPVPWSSRWSWSLHLFLGRPMFLRPFGLYCSACFGSPFVSILCTCCRVETESWHTAKHGRRSEGERGEWSV